MATAYTETPLNFSDIEKYIKNDIVEIKNIFTYADRILFYDTFSFQRHSNLASEEQRILINYYKKHNSAIFITKGILMELASTHHILLENYVKYIKQLDQSGINVVLYNEEYSYDILSECYTTNQTVNAYLMWAARMVKSPISTISETLKIETKLKKEVIDGKNANTSDLYQRFFTAVRNNKEPQDSLGEELISICIFILSNLPEVLDGKLCILTDDKGHAGKIDSLFKKTNPNNRSSKFQLLSTPKLVQYMFQEQVDMSKENMINIISQGTSGNIVVMGITAYDLGVNERISLTAKELVQKIREPNAIKIIF